MAVEAEVEAAAPSPGRDALVPKVDQGAVTPEANLGVQVVLVQQEVWNHPLPTCRDRRMKLNEPYVRPSSLQQLLGLGQRAS